MIAACSDSTVGVVAGPSSTSVAVPATTTSVHSTTSNELSKFGAAIAPFVVEVDLKSSDIGFLIDVAPFFATGTLLSAQPGPVRLDTKRGVVLRFALDQTRVLRSAKSLVPPNTMVDVEFPNGAYATESNQREVDRAIGDAVTLAPVGTEFALFFGPSNFGTTYQVAGSASWGWIDASQHVHELPTAREEPWIDGSSTVASILTQIDGQATR